MKFKNDDEMFDQIKETLNTPVIGDILDTIGCMHQFLPPEVQPIGPVNKLVGWAMPVLMIDVYGPQKIPFGRLTEALDNLEKNEIYMATGGVMRCAYWGEMLTATAKARGAVGAVVNGWHRDTPQVLEQEWPVFSRGRWAQDSSVRTQVVDFRCTIEIGAVTIQPGDLIVGDIDGVLVVPHKVVNEVLEKSFIKMREEKNVRKAIEGGMSSTEAYKKYGIL